VKRGAIRGSLASMMIFGLFGGSPLIIMQGSFSTRSKEPMDNLANWDKSSSDGVGLACELNLFVLLSFQISFFALMVKPPGLNRRIRHNTLNQRSRFP
jgi:hypothetical protein